MFSLLFLVGDGKIRIQIRIRTQNDGYGSGRPKANGSQSTTLVS
jgi:hypothetical protein